jgi:hypothetical protein
MVRHVSPKMVIFHDFGEHDDLAMAFLKTDIRGCPFSEKPMCDSGVR